MPLPQITIYNLRFLTGMVMDKLKLKDKPWAEEALKYVNNC
jgi:hypothetical protein